MFNCDEHAAYSAASLAFRDRLILDWNRTQQRQTYRDSKRVYYLSLEFLMGRALDNAMLNVGMKDIAKGKAIINVQDLPLILMIFGRGSSRSRFPHRGYHQSRT